MLETNFAADIYPTRAKPAQHPRRWYLTAAIPTNLLASGQRDGRLWSTA